MMLSSLGCVSPPTFIEIEGEPRSKSRPRFTFTGKVYSAKKQRDNENLLKLYFRQHFNKPILAEVAVACVFYRSSRGRIDIDNLLKQIFDAANSICWVDDMQVTGVSAILKLDRDRPRIHIAIAHNGDNLIPGSMGRGSEDTHAVCKACGKNFIWKSFPSRGRTGEYCSNKCRGRQTSLPAAICPSCKATFKPKRRRQVYCCNNCKFFALHTKTKEKHRIIHESSNT
jgi:Holliday junction resolvase RusA-like endonuclease